MAITPWGPLRSATTSGKKAPARGRNWAPPPAEPKVCWDADPFHIEEERAGAAALGHLALALLRVLARFLAILAAHREGQRAQTLLRDFLAAVEAVTVVPVLEPRKGVVDFIERLRLHLDERELDVFLNVGLGALDGVEHFVELAAPRALFADAAHLALHLSLNLAPTVVEHLLQFDIARLGHPLFRARLLSVLHTAPPPSPPVRLPPTMQMNGQ